MPIPIDRVYKTITTIASKDIRGVASPAEIRLLINNSVSEIYNEFIGDINRLVNRENRGLINGGLENMADRLRENLLYFLVDRVPITHGSGVFPLPGNCRHIDSVYYLENEAEPCRSRSEFNIISNNAAVGNDSNYPVYLISGSNIKIAPATIQTGVTISYLRTHLIANWTYQVINGAEIFDPSNSSFQDVDLPIDEENNVIVRTLRQLGINLSDQEIAQYGAAKEAEQFNESNAS